MDSLKRAVLSLGHLSLLLVVLPHTPAHSQGLTSAICPLTGAAPTIPSVPFTRCLDANAATCCPACSDTLFGLRGVSSNVSLILCNLLPDYCSLFQGSYGSGRLCGLLSSCPVCELMLEEMLCAVTCNPDAGNYLSRTTTGRYELRLCSSFADRAFHACRCKLPGAVAPLNVVVPDGHEFVSRLFHGFSQILSGQDFSITVTTDTVGCFNGAKQPPPQPLCCDPLPVSSSCPSGMVSYVTSPPWSRYMNRTINQTECQQEIQTSQSIYAIPSPQTDPHPSSGMIWRSSALLPTLLTACILLLI